MIKAIFIRQFPAARGWQIRLFANKPNEKAVCITGGRRGRYSIMGAADPICYSLCRRMNVPDKETDAAILEIERKTVDRK